MIWDTGSFYLYVESDLCTSNCPAPTFTTASSTSFTNKNTPLSVNYLDGTSLSGTLASDQACVTSNAASCISNFDFIAVESGGLDSDTDGLIGMAARNGHGSQDSGFFVAMLFS